MLCGNVSQDFKDNGKIALKISTGRPRSAVTQINKRKVKRLIKSHSGRKIAAKLNISKGAERKFNHQINTNIKNLFI